MASIFAPPLVADDRLSFDPWIDGGMIAGGAAAFFGADFLLEGTSLPIPASPDFSAVPGIDAWLMTSWNGGADTASTITEWIAALSPMAFAALAGDEWLECASITVEALLWSAAAKDVLKWAVPRLRPWAYYGPSGVPADMVDEAWMSFPSGHATVAFAGASALATLALCTDALGEAGPWVAGAGLGFAAATAVLRVASGSHFLTDVLAGAALGGGIGWLTAWLHIKSAEASKDDPVAPTSMATEGSARGPDVRVSPYGAGVRVTLAF